MLLRMYSVIQYRNDKRSRSRWLEDAEKVLGSEGEEMETEGTCWRRTGSCCEETKILQSQEVKQYSAFS